MKSLDRHWTAIESRLRAPRSSWLLLFDFDGTLAPIQKDPSRARLQAGLRKALRRLSLSRRARVGLVSGRSLSQIQALVGLRTVAYIGNHGCEIKGPGVRFLHPNAQATETRMKYLAGILRQRLTGRPGSWVEDKRYTLSVHYRNTPASIQNLVAAEIRREVHRQNHSGLYRVRSGKKVIEIRPVSSWDKGTAVRWLRRKTAPKARILYAGDDRTDEDVFRQLSSRDLTIRVGSSGRSAARYTLTDPAAAARMILRLERIFSHG